MTQRRDRTWVARPAGPTRLALAALAVAATAVPTIAVAGAGAAPARGICRRCGLQHPGPPAPRGLQHPALQFVPDLGPTSYVFDPSMPPSRDPGDGRRHRRRSRSATSSAPQRYALLFKPGTYGIGRRTRSTSRSATTPRSPGLGRTRATSSSTARSTSATSATQRQLHRAEQLLALAVEPDDQRHQRRRLRLLHRRVLGRVAGRADAPGARQRADHADGLLHRPVLRERRLHRRLAASTAQSHQRLAAAVLRPQQRARRLDERRLEPGLLRRRRRARRVLPGVAGVRRPVHDARRRAR